MLPLLGVIGSVAGGAIGALGSQAAAREQAAATRYAADIQRQNYQDQMKALQPAIQAGNTAREYQLGALGLPGGQGYDAATDAFRTSPGYDFAMRSGINNAQTSAAAGGRLFSGSTLKSLSDRAQGMADQEYGSWYNRLSGLSGAGQAATGQGVGLGTATANNLSQLAVQGGDNQASSYGLTAGILNRGLQNIANQYAYYNPPQNQQPGGLAGLAGLTPGGLY